MMQVFIAALHHLTSVLVVHVSKTCWNICFSNGQRTPSTRGYLKQISSNAMDAVGEKFRELLQSLEVKSSVKVLVVFWSLKKPLTCQSKTRYKSDIYIKHIDTLLVVTKTRFFFFCFVFVDFEVKIQGETFFHLSFSVHWPGSVRGRYSYHPFLGSKKDDGLRLGGKYVTPWKMNGWNLQPSPV